MAGVGGICRLGPVASSIDRCDVSRRVRNDTSPLQLGDTSPEALGDVSSPPRQYMSPAAADDGLCPRNGSVDHAGGERLCQWCNGVIVADTRSDSIFCQRKCRQAAFRIRKRRKIDKADQKPKRFAYADPPYPGMAWMYRNEPSYAGEVDHAALVSSLVDRYDGWALSTSAMALVAILPLCPAEARVCAWVKPIGVAKSTYGMHNAWEPVIVVAGRRLRPGKRDWLAAQPAKGGDSKLIGRKPEAFCCWLFDLLGMLPGDQFDDLFPGSGIVSRAWNEICRR